MEMPVKRRRGRPSLKDSITQHYRPEFFKIYLPEHNSKQLVIPPAFISNFNGRIPSKFILKTLQGKDWNVELEQDGNKLLMKKGWDRFVIDNSLELGEFLIFVYVSKTTFIVKIFSINGCVKKESTTINDPSYTKVKEEPKLDQESSPSTSSCKTSFKSDVKHEQISDDKCEVMKNVVEGRTTQLKRIRFSKVVDGRPYLTIPAAVFTSNNVEFPNSKTEILLGYGSEFSQVVKLSQTTRRRVQITYGWKAFQLKYNIVKGDECKFEVIVGNDMHIKEIVLLQIRSNSRLIRCR